MLYKLIKMQSHACLCVCNYAKRNATPSLPQPQLYLLICCNNGRSESEHLCDKNTIGSKGREKITRSTCGIGNDFYASLYAAQSFQSGISFVAR